MSGFIDRQRCQHGAQHLHALGARAVQEFLMEVGVAHDCLDDVLDRLRTWQRLTPNMVRAAGGDRFPPAPIHAVAGDR